MQAGVGLLVSDVMPIYMIIALNIVITMRFSINCPTVICLPTVCYSFEREASSENYGPRVYFLSYIKSKIPCCNFSLFILFCIFVRSIYQNLYNLIYLNTVEELTTPLTR